LSPFLWGGSIFTNLFGTKQNKSIDKIEDNLSKSFTNIKEAFDDHRESINQNTNEIQSNYEYLCKLEAKMDKLAERIDELTLLLTQGNHTVIRSVEKEEEPQYIIPELSPREREVFLVLYTSEDSLTYQQIARKTALNASLIMNYLVTLISKGVPIIKKYMNNEVYVLLDNDFKQLQAKKNILNIMPE
jgi:hypothetical protein